MQVQSVGIAAVSCQEAGHLDQASRGASALRGTGAVSFGPPQFKCLHNFILGGVGGGSASVAVSQQRSKGRVAAAYVSAAPRWATTFWTSFAGRITTIVIQWTDCVGRAVEPAS